MSDQGSGGDDPEAPHPAELRHAPPALEELRTLVGDRADLALHGDGYLDALGGESVPKSMSQQAMQSGALPLIYENLWRPFLFGAASLGLTEGQEARLMRELLAIRQGSVVLDVACGPGNTLRRLTDHAGPDGLVVGVDAAPGMLARAVTDTQAHNAAFLLADASRLPFADGTFDAVSCFGALYLVDDPFTVLDELVRVLAPGGRVAILTTCQRAPWPISTAVGLGGRVAGFRWFGRTEITRALEVRGLFDVRREIRGLVQYVGAQRPG